MTRDHTIETPITDATEFQTALATIVESAIEEGVDVRGAWEFCTRGSILEWEVNVTELDRSADPPDDETDT